MLLAVLGAHLAFMASPLHALSLAEVAHVRSMERIGTGASAAALYEQDPEGQRVGHCGIQWMKAAPATILAGPLVAALAGASSVLGRHVPGMRPITRALGPSVAGDPRALMRVFRL